MRTSLCKGILFLIAVAAAWGVAGCSKADLNKEIVATANGDEIKVVELREFLGVRGGAVPASDVPADKKKEALDRLIAGRLLAREARAKGLDNTDDFRNLVKQNEQGALITALFRKEIASSLKVSKEDLEAEAKKLKEADKSLSEDNAAVRAGRSASEAKMRKIEEDLIAAARKEVPATIDQGAIDRIGKGAKLEDRAVLGTAGGEKVSYGDVKALLRKMSGAAAHGGQDLSANPVAVGRMLEREITGRALAAYARKQGIEGSEWMKAVRLDMERSILIDLLADRQVLKGVEVTDKEIGDAYAEHGRMFVREGKKIPLSAVKEQIRGFLENEKRKKVLEAYIEELKKKSKITVKEEMLPKV